MATNPAPKPRPMRWWLPTAIIVIAVLTITVLTQSPELPAIKKIGFRALTVAISFGLLLIWFLFLSAFRWRTRGLVLVALALALFGFKRLVRMDGSADGSGRPKLAWKSSPRISGEIQSHEAAAPPSPQPAGEIKASLPYPGLLGPDRTGVIPGVVLDTNWASHPPQQLWRQPVGLGWSGFAVVDTRAVTQEQRGENELVVCYELATGRALWLHTNHVRFNDKIGGDGPRSTPAIADGRVYALGGTGILDCLDLTNGSLIWTRDTLKQCQQPNLVFGQSCSPLLVDDLVITSAGQTNGPTLWAFRQDNGSNVWQSGTDNASYSSPALATICGTRQILSVNAASLTAHRPADGRILWQYDWKGWGPRCAQPVVLEGDRVFLSAGFGVGCLMLQIKTNSAGGLSPFELWKSMKLKTQFSSALVRGGFAYGLDESDLVCLDLATGQRQWKSGHYGYGQLLLVGDVLLIQTEPGPVVLVAANSSEFHELAHLDALSSKTWNSPALAGEYFLTRNDHEAACYRLPVQPHQGR